MVHPLNRITYNKTVFDLPFLRPVYTTEILGTDPSEKWYTPHIFAHVNNAYHDFSDGYGPLLFSVLGP